MADKVTTGGIGRRDFFKQAAGVIGVAAQGAFAPGVAEALRVGDEKEQEREADAKLSPAKPIAFPRVFKGEQLKMLAFPLGGVAAGSIALGGRGQLRDWEIFNRPNKGFTPPYGFPAIWVKAGDGEPVARVLESRILPPYEGGSGLDSQNVPGLGRLAEAEFTGQYPLAKVRFKDAILPVRVELEAFSPFIPHDADESGLPVAILRYTVTNPGRVAAKVGISFSIENPVRQESGGYWVAHPPKDVRTNTFRAEAGLEGLEMTNPGLAASDPLAGSLVLGVLPAEGAQVTHWRGWPSGRWWNAPLLFWDAFSRDGALLEEPKSYGAIGALCQQRTIAAGATAEFTFMIAWHFPNRTPEWCGWDAPAGEEKAVIGNFYSTRFKSAWDAAKYTAAHLASLESRTRAFAEAFAASTVPGAVKEAASANMSILATTTCFRTADGAFHGFEGSNDKSGCCYGNCLHVWNYETATAFLFPSFARSLRDSAFGFSMDAQGGMRFRQMLPDGKELSKIVAADGQMGQIIHAHLDWKISGDTARLKTMWPSIRKAVEFAWIKGGWDPERKGVMEGVQHTTYDVEFYGPNPLGGIFYLGALRAAEEMARAVGDEGSAAAYRKLFELGSRWTDANLFQGEYYKQIVRGFKRDEVAPQLISGFGSDSTEVPEYQMGGGCLIDQLLGQQLANMSGLGPLVAPEHIEETLKSIYRYNYKRTMVDHESVQRTYVLNDEAAVVVCDYGKAPRPTIPFPYYAEAWTGEEHAIAALMIQSGMYEHGVEFVENVRARYDGIKRNPWDEAECGHHYARAMSAWSSFQALSGFDYDGVAAAVVAVPRMPHAEFKSFWATGTGWGTFSYAKVGGKGRQLAIRVIEGRLPCRSVEMTGVGAAGAVQNKGQQIPHTMKASKGRTVFHLEETLGLAEGGELVLEIHG